VRCSFFPFSALDAGRGVSSMPGGAHENMRGWSPEEDELLLQLIETSGKRWKLIAEALGNANPRTPAMVRNRYLRIERGRWLTEQGKSKNRCGQCGELKRGHVCRVPRALVSTSLDDQSARHMEARARLADGEVVDVVAVVPSPGRTTTLALGGAQPLTMPLHHDGDGGPATNHSMMSSPGPLSCGLSLGLSPLGTATPGGGFGALSAITGGPPSLRAQNSMDILLQASDLHRIRTANEVGTPGITPLHSEFDSNPFKLPTVKAADLPVELQTTEAVATPKGCAEAAAHIERAQTSGDAMRAHEAHTAVPVLSV